MNEKDVLYLRFPLRASAVLAATPFHTFKQVPWWVAVTCGYLRSVFMRIMAIRRHPPRWVVHHMMPIGVVVRVGPSTYCPWCRSWGYGGWNRTTREATNHGPTREPWTGHESAYSSRTEVMRPWRPCPREIISTWNPQNVSGSGV